MKTPQPVILLDAAGRPCTAGGSGGGTVGGALETTQTENRLLLQGIRSNTGTAATQYTLALVLAELAKLPKASTESWRLTLGAAITPDTPLDELVDPIASRLGWIHSITVAELTGGAAALRLHRLTNPAMPLRLGETRRGLDISMSSIFLSYAGGGTLALEFYGRPS